MSDRIKILIVDDEDSFRFMAGMSLESAGFAVSASSSGTKALQQMKRQLPDLVLLDLNMPEPNGHQVREIMKQDINLRHTPIIILTSSDEIDDKLRGLEGGADDYINKFTDFREIEARIRMVIRRNAQNMDSNPLSKLPGNNVIQEVIQERMRIGEPFAVAYTDLDNFKAFNDKYGFQKGDRVILFTVAILKNALEKYGTRSDFLGHIGGDDFVIVSEPETIMLVCEEVIRLLDAGISQFYSSEDRETGFILTRDRQGIEREFPFISISIAVANSMNRNFKNIGEVVRIVTELKKFAKQKDGSCVVVDKRSD